jgi:hypothetical protein
MTAVSVGELLNILPESGGNWTLHSHDWVPSQLYVLLGTGKELVLHAVDIVPDERAVRLALTCGADTSRESGSRARDQPARAHCGLVSMGFEAGPVRPGRSSHAWA